MYSEEPSLRRLTLDVLFLSSFIHGNDARWMKEERDKTWGRGGLPTLARSFPQYISAFTTRVLQSTYVCVGEREPEPEFLNF
jgi:hypothetical protein